MWGDGWFYVCALGFAASLALFVYFLGQYRAAVEAEEGDEEAALAPAAMPAPGEKVYVPKAAAGSYPEPVAVIKPAAKPESAPMPVVGAAPKEAAPASPAPFAGPDRRRETATSSGGLSPAVVFIQNLKLQVDAMEKELAQLKALSVQQAAQGELILRKLAELAARPAAAQPAAEPKPEPQPVDERALPSTETEALAAAIASHVQTARAAETTTPPADGPRSIELKLGPPPPQESAAAAVEPASAPSEPLPSTPEDKTLLIEPSTRSIKPESTAELKMKPQAEPSPSEAPKPRKGPVWPI